MKKLIALLGTLAGLAAGAGVAAAEDVLHLYNWNNYMSEETVKRFEGVCKCKVKQTYYSDNDELIAKLQADPDLAMSLMTESEPGVSFEIMLPPTIDEAAATILEELVASLTARTPPASR